MKPVSGVRFTDSDMGLAEHLAGLMDRNNPDRKKRTGEVERWADDIRLIRERDGRTADQIRQIIDFTQNDPFWMLNILSGANLRKHYDRLNLQMKGGHHERGTGTGNGANRRDRHRPGLDNRDGKYNRNDLDAFDNE